MSATQYMDPSKRDQMEKESAVRLKRLEAARALASPSDSSSTSSSPRSENSSEFERRMTQGSPAGEMTAEDYEQLRQMDISPIHTPTATIMPPLSSSSSLTPSPTPSSSATPPPPEYDFPDVPTHLHPVHRDMPDAPTHEVEQEGPFRVIHSEDRDALNNFGVETPDHEKDPEAYNRNLEDFLRFYQNPTLSRNRRPFAQGRRTKKCRRCQRCKPCKRSRKYYRRDKGKRRSLKKRSLRRPSYKRRKYKR
jgi:hypothetical protein